MGKLYPYPPQEHCEVPRNPHAQVDEELRLYPTHEEFLGNLKALRALYGSTPFMQTISEFSRLAGLVRSPNIEGVGTRAFNLGFYEGSLVAAHINIAPADANLKYRILTQGTLKDLEYWEERDETEKAIEKFMDEWASDDEGSWKDFFESQTEEYQVRALTLAELVYPTDVFAPEAQLDFMLGYTFTSNLIWTTAPKSDTTPPV